MKQLLKGIVGLAILASAAVAIAEIMQEVERRVANYTEIAASDVKIAFHSMMLDLNDLSLVTVRLIDAPVLALQELGGPDSDAQKVNELAVAITEQAIDNLRRDVLSALDYASTALANVDQDVALPEAVIVAANSRDLDISDYDALVGKYKESLNLLKRTLRYDYDKNDWENDESNISIDAIRLYDEQLRVLRLVSEGVEGSLK